MKRIISALTLLPLLAAFTACNEDEQFQGELYKKVIYVLSDDDLIFQSEHQLGEESTGYLTIYCGGTEHLQKDVTVELEFDNDLLGEYNYRFFDIDESKYAVLLPKENYSIESFTTVLRASSEDNYALLPIKIRPDGLDPDTRYMLPLRIKSVSDYEINPNKQRVLFNVMPKNKYASILNPTYYQTTGFETMNLSSGDVTTTISVTRPVVPVSKNQIRMFAGAHTYVVGAIDKEEREKYAMTVTLNDDGSIGIEPYGSIEIEQIGGKDKNYYYTNEKTGNLTLIMNYRFKDTVTYNGATEECWVTMAETAIKRASAVN